METTKRTWKLQDFVAHKANVNCLALGHKSNQVLATGGDDKKVNLWAVGRYSCLMSLSGHTTPVESVCFGQSEDLVCAGSQTGALKIWDLEAAKLMRTYTGHKGAVKCMDFHPYSDFLASGSTDSTIKLWDTRKRGCAVTYSSHRMAVNSLQFSPDGQWIASASEDGLVKVWDFRMGKVLKDLQAHTASVTCVKFHPHELLLASCGADRQLNFWDMERFTLVSNYEKDGAAVKQMAFSEEGYCLLGCGEDGLSVIAFEPARTLDRIQAHWTNIHDVTLAQNHLIVGSYHSTYVMLSVVDLTKVYPFGGANLVSPPYAVDTSPFNKAQSVRKSFSKERPNNLSPPKYVHEEKTIEESSTDDDSAIIADIKKFTEIFRPSRSLNRTPPPCTSAPCLDNDNILHPEIPVTTETRSPTRLRDITSPELKRASRESTTIANEMKKKEELKKSKENSELRKPSKLPTWDYNTPVMPEKNIRSQMNSGSDNISHYVSMSCLNTNIPSPPVVSLPPVFPNFEPTNDVSNIPSAVNSIKTSISDTSLTQAPAVNTKSISFVRANTDLTRKASRDRTIRRAGSPNVEIYDRPSSRRNLDEDRRVMASSRFNCDEDRPKNSNGYAVDDDMSGFDTDFSFDLADFLPKSTSGLSLGDRRFEMTDREVIASLMNGHAPIMTVLRSRQRSLQIFHNVRISKGLAGALESIIAINDSGVLVDILNIMANRPASWTLDVVKLLLPKLHELLESKYESYNSCAASALKMVLRNFAPVVKTNALRPVCSPGVDLTREERYNKCVAIAKQFDAIRDYVERRVEAGGPKLSILRDVQTVFQQCFD